MFNVVFYRTPDNKSPVEEFLDDLFKTNRKLWSKLVWTISLLERFGNGLRLPYSEYLRDDIFELRAIYGNNIARLLYFFSKGKLVIAVHGLVKKTQKTPAKDIDLAISRKKEYEGRDHDE